MLIEAVTQITEGPVYILYGNDDLNIAASVTIQSTGTDAVTTWDGQHTVSLSGQIFSHDDGLNFIGCTAQQTINIAVGARIKSGDDGTVQDADGVILDGLNSVLTNRGTINSFGSAVSLFVREGGTTVIANYGTMTGEREGIWYKWGGGTLNFTNYGTIESPGHSYLGNVYGDIVTNRGTMRGDIDLGGANDLYTGLGGTVVGLIGGGDGDDRFVLGASADRVDGGTGSDTIEFSTATAGLTVDLETAANNRGVLVVGDSYSSIENVTGGTRNDVLRGNAEANVLHGNAGYDALSGGAGDDVLDGGANRDTLSGGAGSDMFVFASQTGLRDIITDFDVTVDHVQLEGSAFGYGDATGAVSADDFVIGTTTAALDASDRFIFKTTDTTLWFDRDGKGGTAAILVCDLQAGASLTAANLLLI